MFSLQVHLKPPNLTLTVCFSFFQWNMGAHRLLVGANLLGANPLWAEQVATLEKDFLVISFPFPLKDISTFANTSRGSKLWVFFSALNNHAIFVNSSLPVFLFQVKQSYRA